MTGREHVDHRDGGVGGELLEHRVRAGPHADRADVAGEHERGVAQRLAARELEVVGAQDHRMAPELDDAGLEGHPRPRRGLLEDQRDRPPLEHLELRGAAFSSSARSTSAAISSRESSVPVSR